MLRGFFTQERDLITLVFGNSIILGQVRLQDDLGAGGRPWTTPPTPLYSAYYRLHVGPAFGSMISSSFRRRLLIHEMTHVWQGQFRLPFVFNSAWHQTLAVISTGGDVAPAYTYTTGSAWKNYNCEQQASIVEDWYVNGSLESDTRFRYIRDNIRKGAPWA
jgi:hypothetical protein